MLIKPTKIYCRTTHSNHWFKKHPNLIRDIVPNRPNYIYVSDITYIPTIEGFLYLFLITDAFSRRIVGQHLADSLIAEGSLIALNKSIKLRTDKEQELIHHSDRGSQYCCKEYTKLLEDNKIAISMTEDNHVYENALAERVNGILKSEFIGFEPIINKKIAKKLVEQSISIYNTERLHTSLGFKTPEEVHFN